MVRHSLTSGILRTLLHAFVSCLPDYCNSLLIGSPACDIRCLQSVQNAAARLYGDVSEFDSIQPVMRGKLHWLPIFRKFRYNVDAFTFKAMNGRTPVTSLFQ